MSDTKKERPILFSGSMVQALLDGRKTQTRRIVKWPDWVTETGKLKLALQRPPTGLAYYVDGHPVKRFACPYGIPGDRMWVREAFFYRSNKTAVVYKADLSAVEAAGVGALYGGWKPSIHMPRLASRITLEITEVRVQRLQEISEEDAKAEGGMFHDGRGIGHSGWRHDFKEVHADARSSFARLWESINGPDSWAANPWVWCVSFKRVQGEEGKP